MMSESDMCEGSGRKKKTVDEKQNKQRINIRARTRIWKCAKMGEVSWDAISAVKCALECD
jgi:hypothetical protein